MKSNLQLHTEAVRLRRANGYGSTEPVDITRLLMAQENYTLVRLPMTENISGMCIVDCDSKIIGVNSGMSLGRQRFTIAHELYHIEIEHTGSGVICKKNANSDSEREADQFASYFLLPNDALDLFVEKNHVDVWDIESLVKLSQLFRMSFQAILFRLHQEHRIDDTDYREWMNLNILKCVRGMASDVNLYMKSPEHEMEQSYGQYGRLLERAQKDGKISDSLYRQFAIEGFCSKDWDRLSEEALIYD